MTELNNYLVDGNPFNLKPPPEFWLRQLRDFDDSLVVMPSNMGFFYRLAQRRPPDPRTRLVHSLSPDSDSMVMARHGLVPVTTIVAHAKWDNAGMWRNLAERIPSRNGGWEAYEQKIIALEKGEELKQRAERDDMLDIIAKDSRKFYDYKRGVRNQLWSPTIKGSDKPAENRSAAIRIKNANNTKATIFKS